MKCCIVKTNVVRGSGCQGIDRIDGDGTGSTTTYS